MLLRKLIAISLFSIYLFSTTELHQLLKLPFLVTHFLEHKTQNGDITLLTFLHLHYANGHQKDADYDKDMQLPFKSNDGCINASIAPFIPISLSTEISRPVYIQSNNFTLRYDVDINSFFLSNIWQPPKSC